jgi:hypothetical protein
MSNTPETDAALYPMNQVDIVWPKFARKLERERDEALMDRANGDIATMTRNHYERILREAEYYKERYEQLKDERDEARELLRLSSIEANALATSIQKSEYSDVNDFQLCESVAGVISQINNMYAGVREQRDEAREAFKIVYNERVQMELERNEWKNKAYSHATDYTLMEAKCFRLEQQLKEYDQLKS